MIPLEKQLSDLESAIIDLVKSRTTHYIGLELTNQHTITPYAMLESVDGQGTHELTGFFTIDTSTQKVTLSGGSFYTTDVGKTWLEMFNLTKVQGEKRLDTNSKYTRNAHAEFELGVSKQGALQKVAKTGRHMLNHMKNNWSTSEYIVLKNKQTEDWVQAILHGIKLNYARQKPYDNIMFDKNRRIVYIKNGGIVLATQYLKRQKQLVQVAYNLTKNGVNIVSKRELHVSKESVQRGENIDIKVMDLIFN